MGLPLFFPLVLAEVAEVAASSTSMGPHEPAAGAGAAEEEGPDGAFGDGPLSMVAHGSLVPCPAGPGAPCGEGAGRIFVAKAAATLPRAGAGAARTGRAEGGRIGASGRGPSTAVSGVAAAQAGPV